MPTIPDYVPEIKKLRPFIDNEKLSILTLRESNRITGWTITLKKSDKIKTILVKGKTTTAMVDAFMELEKFINKNVK